LISEKIIYYCASDEDEKINAAGFIVEEPGEKDDINYSSTMFIAEEKVSGIECKENENE
jgi:hypothetical protein